MPDLITSLKENLAAHVKGGSYKEIAPPYLCFDFSSEDNHKIRILALDPTEPSYDQFYLRSLINKSILKGIHVVLFYDDCAADLDDFVAHHEEFNIYRWDNQKQQLYWENSKYTDESDSDQEEDFENVLSELSEYAPHLYDQDHYYKFASLIVSSAFIELLTYSCEHCNEKIAAAVGYLFPFHEGYSENFDPSALYEGNGDYLVSLYCMSKPVMESFKKSVDSQDQINGLRITPVLIQQQLKEQIAEISCPHCEQVISRKLISDHRHESLTGGNRKNLMVYLPCEINVDYLSMFFSHNKSPYRENSQTKLYLRTP